MASGFPPLPPKPTLKPHTDDTSVRRNAPTTSTEVTSVKLEQTEQYHSSNGLYDDVEEGHRVKMEDSHPTNDFIVKQDDTDQEHAKYDEEEEVAMRRGKKRQCSNHPISTSRRMHSTYRGDHRNRLDALLHKFVREHGWKEAAGVLSVLVKGSPCANNITDKDLRRNHMVAMELHRRSFSSDDRKYETWIRQIFDTWMSKLSRTRDDSRKKNEILMEIAIFYFTRGNFDEARNMMQLVIQDNDLANRPSVNLLHGMILYQIWYSGLPEEYKIKGFNNCAPIQIFGLASNNDFREMEIGENSTNHFAAVTEDAKFSSRNASNSSFGNYKVFKESKNDGPETEIVAPPPPPPPQEFYVSHSTDQNEQKPGACNPDNNLLSSSIFFARGLDSSLLPIRLNHLTGDVEQIIYEYRRLADENYSDAVEHLRLALHSAHPVYAAFLPLIQLLLLGDRVEEAFAELENSCHTIDTALPFRLMARLLECFQSNKITQICSYYENALKRDPICYHSLERLIKMHKSGNYSSMLMFEIIVLHLDAADGHCTIWEELALCFLRIQTPTEYEDYSSKKLQRGRTNILLSRKIPKAFLKEAVRGSWKLRFAWWQRRHFSISSLPEQFAGDRKMLCFKAACASHLYGPKYEYVMKVLKNLRADNDLASILIDHIQNAMNLFEHL